MTDTRTRYIILNDDGNPVIYETFLEYEDASKEARTLADEYKRDFYVAQVKPLTVHKAKQYENSSKL